MDGFQLTFFTQQNRRHHGRVLAQWVLEQARNMGIHGATLFGASEGFGRHGRIHSMHFFDLADQPLELVMAVTPDECDRLFALLRAENVRIVYVKSPVEFGEIGGKE